MKLCYPLTYLAVLLGLTAFVCGQAAVQSSRASSADASQDLKPGVVVEEIAKYSEAEKAGLKQGDIILRWARGEATGEIGSPFDLSSIETEQEPRGPVTLEGLSSGQKQVWTLGPSDWGIKGRPNFSEPALTMYRQGQELAKAGKPAEAAERWRLLAGQVSHSPSVWLLYHSAEVLADARQWKEVDSVFQEAVGKAAGIGPGISASLLQAWAQTFDQRSDWANVERYYQQSITESQKLGGESLMIAMNLESLGEVARKRGDPRRAAEFHSQALDIRQKLAPGSLAVASSLNGLGIVAWTRGDLAKAEDYLHQALDLGQKLAPGGLAVGSSFNGLGVVALARGDLAKAEEFYSQALTIRQKLVSGSLAVAASFSGLAIVVEYRGDLSKAEEYYGQALEIRKRRSPGSLDVAASFNNLGIITLERGDPAKAEEYYRQSLDIKQKLAPDSITVANTLNNLGQAVQTRGELVKAEEYYNQALEIRKKLAPGGLDVAASLTNLGNVTLNRGNLTKAEEYHRQSLDIKLKLAPGSLLLSATLNELGVVAWQRGDLAKAEEYHRQALDIQKKLAPASLTVAGSFQNLGIVAADRGDLAKAEEYYIQALDIEKKLASGSLTVTFTLDGLGVVAREQGDLAKAEEYFGQALQIKQKLASGSLYVADSFNNLGEIARDRGDLATAETYHHQSLDIRQKLAPGSLAIADSFNNLGNVARDRGDLARAEEYYHQALTIREKLAPGSSEHAETLAALASVMRRKQQPDAAAQLFAKALDALENQTSRLGGGEEDRSNFRAKHAGYYRDYMDLLISQKQSDRALEVLERSRSRTLLEMLAAAHIDVHKGVDPALLEREHSLSADLHAKSSWRIRLLSDQHTDEQIAAIDREIRELLTQLKDVKEQIRVHSPSYAALTQPKTLSTKEIQLLLDEDTLLLEYALGEERSYVLAVTANSLNVYELPKRARIESSVRRLHQRLTTWERGSRSATPGAPARQPAGLTRETGLRQSGADLSEMVLAPVAGLLRGKRLLIVSDGALQYIPFSALPTPPASTMVDEARSQTPLHRDAAALRAPLIAGHEVVYLPSASVLAVLRQDARSRPEPAKMVAVLADPVFDLSDERLEVGLRKKSGQATRSSSADGKTQKVRSVEVKAVDSKAQESASSSASEPLASEHLTRSLADVRASGRFYLSRLPYTRQEAQAIMLVTPEGQGMEALGFSASRATAMGTDLGQYRIVHFATHGLLDSENPELSGLVFSLLDQKGMRQDGFLQLQDIYNLNLPVDLVVLSACETGLGKEIQGEGLVGLTRGFMYAGASRVVASLWKVDDVATAELMERFYKNMEREKMRPAAALRQAQMQMWQRKRWHDPYYWAGFELQGEWK